MIEDAVNAMNDIDANYGELERITERSHEASSLHQSNLVTREQMEQILVKSILDTIPSEISSGEDENGCSC